MPVATPRSTPSKGRGRWGPTGGAKAEKETRATGPGCLRNVFLVIKVTDDDSRALGECEDPRGGKIPHEPPEDDRPVGCGAQCRCSACVLVTKNRVVRMSLS